jgi:phosphoribosylformylglycinamidine synthase
MVKELTPTQIQQQKPYLAWGLSEKEYDYISKQLIKRLPNYTETGLFAVMWSEHCSYKMSKPPPQFCVSSPILGSVFCKALAKELVF